jgi:hypothetical protein
MLIAVSMLSLVAGMFLLIKAWKEEMCCKLFPKIVGYAVVVISILLIICGGYRMACKHPRPGLGPEKEMMGPSPMGERGMHHGMMRGAPEPKEGE